MFLWYKYFKNQSITSAFKRDKSSLKVNVEETRNFATQALWTQLHAPEKWEKPTFPNSQSHKGGMINAVRISLIHQAYSTWETGLNYTSGGRPSSAEVHWEAKQLHTSEDARVGFFCSSPNRRKCVWVFFSPDIFCSDRDNSKT